MHTNLVVLDLDNTLYDWVGYYVPSFLAMVNELSRLSGIDSEELKREFKKIHEKYRSTEYSFSIEQLEALQQIDPHLSSIGRVRKYASAIDAFRAKRGQLLRLYPSVEDTLATLKRNNVFIAALTDTTVFYASQRLKQLRIEEYFDILCAPEDHGIPAGIDPDEVRSGRPERYAVNIPIVVPVEAKRRKPDPLLLRKVIEAAGTTPQNTVVVGDSLSRDVKMAQDCGAWDVYAQYGTRLDPALYQELLKITYWTADEVSALDQPAPGTIHPNFTITEFAGLIKVISRIESGQEDYLPDSARGGR